MRDAPPRTVYRVVRSDPPAARDFFSAAALGRRFSDSRLTSLADGISVFETEAQARRQAVRYNLGRFIAELRLPASVVPERTQRRTSGHHTVRAEPAVLLAAVVRVVPVD